MTLNRIGAIALGVAFCLPALADTQFRVRRMTRDDVPLGKGQCDIRLQVDNEVEVSVRGDSVFIRTISGRDAYYDGSECNAPLPGRAPGGFHFEVMDSRNEIRLVSEPSPRTNWAAVVLIRDSAGGQGRYHFRISWDASMRDDRPLSNDRPRPDDRGGFEERRPGPPGFVWNNVVNFRGEGRGTATLDGFDRRLGNVNVDIDRGGHVLIVFRAQRGGDLTFSGQVINREGGRLRCEVSSSDRRYRGPMFLSIGDRDNVNSITFEGGDGRDRMRIAWDRR
jgi:hypothetical protein